MGVKQNAGVNLGELRSAILALKVDRVEPPRDYRRPFGLNYAAKAISALHRGPSLLDWLADGGAVAITMGLMAFVGNTVEAAATGPEQS